MLQTEKWTVTTLEGNFSATCTLNAAKKQILVMKYTKIQT